MDNDWRKDPRLKAMSPQKLELLMKFAKKIETTPKNQLMATFMNINMEAQKSGLSFTDQETDLLVSILTAKMPPKERQKLDTLRMLSRKLSRS